MMQLTPMEVKIGDCINLKGWKKLLEKHYGKRCSEYAFNCIQCEVWQLYDRIKAFVDMDNMLAEPCDNNDNKKIEKRYEDCNITSGTIKIKKSNPWN